LTSAGAAEVTIQNDSLTDLDTGVIQAGFVAGEQAAAWLTSPCGGNLVAVQILWYSATGTTGESLQDSIDIYRAGDFPVPGALAQEIGGPVMTDGFLNEFRYLDDQQMIPLIVPVDQDETVVVAFTFAEDPLPSGPSVVNDTDGIHAARNGIYAQLAPGLYQWFDSAALGVSGDWVIRAVVDCAGTSDEADVAVTMTAEPPQYIAGEALTYAITVANAGPAAAPSTTVVDTFPAALVDPSWTCAPGGGATCSDGSGGTLAQSIALPAGSQVVYTVTGTVAAGTTATLTNSATAVVGAPANDPDPSNNTATVSTDPAPDDDRIFADGFEG
jgi:uncharacterized repeat protein (TIGR01451 family)